MLKSHYQFLYKNRQINKFVLSLLFFFNFILHFFKCIFLSHFPQLNSHSADYNSHFYLFFTQISNFRRLLYKLISLTHEHRLPWLKHHLAFICILSHQTKRRSSAKINIESVHHFFIAGILFCQIFTLAFLNLL